MSDSVPHSEHSQGVSGSKDVSLVEAILSRMIRGRTAKYREYSAGMGLDKPPKKPPFQGHLSISADPITKGVWKKLGGLRDPLAY
ncbi:MAG: hypothetical protein HUU55_02110 [Myxococcales bacterium]|nr:hypothetical protein [Myxococcales bacterium]